MRILLDKDNVIVNEGIKYCIYKNQKTLTKIIKLTEKNSDIRNSIEWRGLETLRPMARMLSDENYYTPKRHDIKLCGT